MEIKLRQNIDKLEVGKSIEFVCDYPSRFKGFLTYYREYYNGYNLADGDELDEVILKEIVHRFSSTARFNISDLLLTENQVEQFKIVTRGGLYKSIKVYFYPLTDMETYIALQRQNKLVYTIKNLQVSILSSSEENLNTHIFNEFTLAFDINKYDLLEKLF